MLAGLGASLAAPAVVRGQALAPADLFKLGVASGDPAPDGFVLWTRLAPAPLEPHGGMPMRRIPVTWEVAADERFVQVVARGEAVARPELAHAVHVETTGLNPGRPYWYRFIVGREASPVGRARTAPAPGAALRRARFAAAGCQHYEHGLYTTWRAIAGEDLDFVWHYGDYIYEGAAGDAPTDAAGKPIPLVRAHVGEEPYSLDDYRRRYALYRTDPDLQAAHAAHSWWATWDDHEVDNNWAADRDRDDTPPGVFDLRRQAAAQAYYEHMPLRAAAMPRGPAIRIWRRARYGDLLEANFLDTRQFRMDQPCGDGFRPVCDAALAPGRPFSAKSRSAGCSTAWRSPRRAGTWSPSK